jgi:hypothetical protein
MVVFVFNYLAPSGASYKELQMKTYRLKEAIQVFAHGGFVKEPSYYFSKHSPFFDKFGALIGWVTYNCYFEITDALGYEHNGGLLKSGRRFEGLDTDRATPFCTISGNFYLVDKMLEVA